MVPLSLVPALALLFFYVSTFRSMCAVPNMAVFCSSLMSWFPGMSLTYFLNDLEMVPVAPIITGIALAFTFHMHCISIVRSLYFKIFLASFLITFLSPEIATSINMHVPFSLSWIIMSGLLLGIYYYYYYYWIVQQFFNSWHGIHCSAGGFNSVNHEQGNNFLMQVIVYRCNICKCGKICVLFPQKLYSSNARKRASGTWMMVTPYVMISD